MAGKISGCRADCHRIQSQRAVLSRVAAASGACFVLFASYVVLIVSYSYLLTYLPTYLPLQDYFSNNPGADNLNKVQAQIEIVKDVMVENIEKILERGEKIELLVDKTDRLNQQAFKFEKSVREEHAYHILCLQSTCILVLINVVVEGLEDRYALEKI